MAASAAEDEKLRKELRPRALSAEAALAVARKHFDGVLKDKGAAAVRRELNSYDDRNYHIATGAERQAEREEGERGSDRERG